MTLWTPIPGETPIGDASGLKIKGITTRRELNICEMENVRKAVTKYLDAKPSRRSARFDFSWVKRLHKEMLGEVWKWAGEMRRSNLSIGVDWQHVENSLYSLLGDLAYWEENNTMPLLDQAVQLHYRAVHIHPFLNGNGRWARLLANIWLKLHGHPITRWPEERVGEESIVRTEYIEALKLADAGDFDSLVQLHRRLTESPPE